MKTLEFVANVGIGDLIHTRQLLDNVLNKGYKINVILGVATFENFWKGEKLEFLIWLSNVLFQKPEFEVYFSANKLGVSPIDLLSSELVVPAIPNFSEKFDCDIKLSSNSNRLILLTKVRGFPKDQFIEYLDAINKEILILSKRYEIVLLGEREIEFNSEYKIHGEDLIYSLYGNFKKLLPNAIDMTIPALGITSPTKEQFLLDCNLMSNSKKVICFGSGGNVSIAMSVSNVLNFYGGNEMLPLFSKLAEIDNKIITNNFPKFIKELSLI